MSLINISCIGLTGVYSIGITEGLIKLSFVSEEHRLAAIGLIFFLQYSLEKRLPQFLIFLQIPLMIASIALFNRIPGTFYGFIPLCLVAIIKLYAVYNFFQNPFRKLVSNFSAPKMSGKEFYNSQEWRKARFAVLNAQGRVCQKCGESRTRDEFGEVIQYHVDHIQPRSRFPHLALELSNLRVTCKACNLGRMADYILDENGNEVYSPKSRRAS